MKHFIYILGVLSILLIPLSAHAAGYPNGCTATTKYSATTGKPCDYYPNPAGCQPGDLYDSNTGNPCGATVAYLPGCTSLYGYSMTTGRSCNQYVSAYNPIVTLSPINAVVSGSTATFTYTLSVNIGSIVGMNSTAAIDGILEPNGDLNNLSQQEINQVGGTDQDATFSFSVAGLSAGSHTLRIAAGGQTQSVTFITS